MGSNTKKLATLTGVDVTMRDFGLFLNAKGQSGDIQEMVHQKRLRIRFISLANRLVPSRRIHLEEHRKLLVNVRFLAL